MAEKKPCMDCHERPKYGAKQRCLWCLMKTKPIMGQVSAADRRLLLAQEKPGYEYRARVPADQWPTGKRWCAGCQYMVPLDYARGSRCIACASRAAHASRVTSTYEITPQQYDELFAWQKGRCYVCGRRTKKRLAIDHDHTTNVVRGLLCADNDWGCNVSLARVLNDLEAARRLVSYIQTPPLQAMLNGAPPPSYRVTPGTLGPPPTPWPMPQFTVGGLGPDPFDPKLWPRMA